MRGMNILYATDEPLKKRRFTVELTDSTLEAFKKKLKNDDTTPEEVLEGFINDLVYGPYNGGSDEVMYARNYYNRCGYPYRNFGKEDTQRGANH